MRTIDAIAMAGVAEEPDPGQAERLEPEADDPDGRVEHDLPDDARR